MESDEDDEGGERGGGRRRLFFDLASGVIKHTLKQDHPLFIFFVENDASLSPIHVSGAAAAVVGAAFCCCLYACCGLA